MTKISPRTIGAEQQVETIRKTLRDTIGSHLMSLYQLGKPTPDGTDLVIVVKNHGDLHAVRQALQPIFHTTERNPLIATSSAISRHLHLDSFMAHHLNQGGILLDGDPISIQAAAMPAPEAIGVLSGLVIDASAVLAPDLLKPGDFETAAEKLNHLANYFNLTTENPIQTLAAIQAQLADMVESQPEIQWSIPAPTGAPPLVEALLAIYERQDRAIFVLPDWPAKEIEAYIHEVDWTAVSNSLVGQYNGLQITTASQIRLMLRYDKTSDFYLQNYIHAWGINALSSFETPQWRIYRDLANLASTYEVQIFARAYLDVTDDQINKLIHDYQNRLLNIQLREELMHRLFNLDRAIPLKPLPGREAPNDEKVGAIFDQFAWWADHYSVLMANHQ